MEFIKDPKEPCGWKRQTYENGTVSKGIGSLPGETMDEGVIQEAEDEG